MTDTMNKFDSAAATVAQRGRAAGYRHGMDQVVNLVAAFQARGVRFGADDFTDSQNEK